jgi:hypothetical protein
VVLMRGISPRLTTRSLAVAFITGIPAGNRTQMTGLEVLFRLFVTVR